MKTIYPRRRYKKKYRSEYGKYSLRNAGILQISLLENILCLWNFPLSSLSHAMTVSELKGAFACCLGHRSHSSGMKEINLSN